MLSDDDFKLLVAQSDSWADVVRGSGLSDGGAGNWKTVQRRADKLGISSAHFTRLRSRGGIVPKSLEEVMIENSTYSRWHLRNRLINSGILEPKCARCGISEWFGQPISLELEHINGVHNDHRLENLELLCPNCHSLTPTWRGRKRKLPNL